MFKQTWRIMIWFDLFVYNYLIMTVSLIT